MPQIEAPVRPRRQHGLFSVVGEIGEVKGLTPLAFESASCAGVEVRYPCALGQPDKVVPPTVPPQGGFEPFWIVSGYQCKAFSDIAEYGQKALDALDGVVERTVENELWASVISPSISLLPIVGVGATPEVRLAAALDFISQCGGAGAGVLHMSAGTAMLLDEHLYRTEDPVTRLPQLRTIVLDLPVTVTSAPIGTTIAITGGVTVELSEPTIVGGPDHWLDIGTNETIVIAERMAAVAFDGVCCAGLVT